MELPLFTVVVPATTANLGPGYDSAGMSLSLYMNVKVSKSQSWEVRYDGEEYAGLPSDESNLIVRTIQKVASYYEKELSPHLLQIKSDIPLGKGLGSSATAIAAGIEIADHILHLGLSAREKASVGSHLEGHADNVTAALLGGVVVTYFNEKEFEVIQLPTPQIGVVILVPPNALKTEESRELLPKQLDHQAAASGSSASSMLTTAIALGDWKLAGKMFEKDLFHEPYRKKMMPQFDEIRAYCHSIGTYGMTISGAGPSLFVAVEANREQEVAALLKKQFPYYESIALKPSEKGAHVMKG